MKRTLVLVLVFALALAPALPVFSQNKKGSFLIGTYVGGGGFGSNHSESTYSGIEPTTYSTDSNSFSLGFGPEIGYYFTNAIVGGLSLDIYFSSNKSESKNSFSPGTDTGKYSALSIGLGPFVRLYFGNPNGKGRPYVQAGTSIALYPSYTSTYTQANGNGYTYKLDKYSSWQADITLGYEHYLNPVIGLYYYVGYLYSRYTSDYTYDYVVGSDYSYKNKESGSAFEFGLGLQIHLGPKKS